MSTQLVRPINDRNQITIPPELLRQLNIRPGNLVQMSLTNGGIMLQPVDVVERKTHAAQATAALTSTA